MKRTNFSDEVGKIYGDMIISNYYKKDNGKWYIELTCSICGRKKESQMYKVKQDNGVSHEYCKININKKNDKRFYDIWTNMKTRIYNESVKEYKYYGGRGISTKYNYFIDFYDDLYESYLEACNKYGISETTIDRIDVNGNYIKENIRWISKAEQQANKRTNRFFKATSPNGEIYYSNNKLKFSKEHNLWDSDIIKTLNGDISHHKNWKFEYIDSECNDYSDGGEIPQQK